MPLILAIHLSKNQRFEEAQQWFHYIFNPTDDSVGPTPERFWKVKPFQHTDIKQIEEILINLSSGDDFPLQQETINNIGAWKDAPLRPHVIARYRQSSYMFKTVMAYLDNLIAWGDTLFRQDTGESINEATQLYVLAANILGPRPQSVPKKGSVRPQTYANLRHDLDEFGNALQKLETNVAFDRAPHPNNAADPARFSTLRSLGSALYFCIPRNDNLLSYWDTVADRLFKIRNSLNIQGTFRQLPLFEPPLDPGLLAKAAAVGLDIGAIISGANQPLPLVRFQVLVQKAAEICQEVKSLGNNLLSAIEKEDNEALAILRAKHEHIILSLTETIKYQQLQEAIKNRESLEASIFNATQRYTYYERLLGKNEKDIKIPVLDALDTDGLEKMNFKANEPEVKQVDIVVNIADSGPGTLGAVTSVVAGPLAGATSGLASSLGGVTSVIAAPLAGATSALAGAADITGGKKISTYEWQELNQLELARVLLTGSSALDTLSSGLSLIPQFNANIEPLGIGAATGFGGVQLSKMFSSTASSIRTIADQFSYEANKTAKMGSYARREQEWAFQSNLVAGEITQLFKQLRAAQIREHLAEQEWKNHKQQVCHAEEIEHFLTVEKNGKKTNQAFYTWMKREVKGLYGQCFQFAFDIAKKAERALQHELGNSELSFLQFGYLAGKEGLLAGEKLYLDIKRMEMAYHDLNQREYELTRHVSLLQVNPLALLQLRATGTCTVFLPEELFDMDCPGHYFRRIRSVGVSIPCVVGPYTSINCTLTLLKSSIRKSPLLPDGSYARDGADDTRFSDHFGSLQAIVTSTGQNDSGLFETNLHDERYLPFEESGVVSEWQLELPDDVRQFDYDTIADVILHLRYTARGGGDSFGNEAVANLTAHIKEAQAAGSVRLFSMRYEFPTEWAKFKSVKLGVATPPAELTLNLREEHYPFWNKDKEHTPIVLKRIDFFAKPAKDTKKTIAVSNKLEDNPIGTRKEDKLDKDTPLSGILSGNLTHIPLPEPIGKFTLYFDDNSMEDLWLALAWGK